MTLVARGVAHSITYGGEGHGDAVASVRGEDEEGRMQRGGDQRLQVHLWRALLRRLHHDSGERSGQSGPAAGAR